MTISQLFGKIAGSVFCVALFGGISACSGVEVEPTPATGGSGNSAGTGSGAAGKTGSAAGTSGSSTAGSNPGGGSKEVVGAFQVQVVADEADPKTGMTKVVGLVADAPTPLAVVWTAKKNEGGCHLETPSVPFCEEGCGADACVAENTCSPYPTNHSVGAVTLQGVKLVDGGSEIALKEIAKAYQPPAGTMLMYPPFGPDDDVSLHATGGDYAAFDLSTKGVDPLALTSTDFELDRDKALELTWTGAADPKATQMYIKLDISHHGGAKGLIECDVDDTGSLTISAALINGLLDLGVAGFPSLVAIRKSIDSAQIAPGVVNLEVSARTEQFVTVKGVASCTKDADCADGKKCQMDLTCK